MQTVDSWMSSCDCMDWIIQLPAHSSQSRHAFQQKLPEKLNVSVWFKNSAQALCETCGWPLDYIGEGVDWHFMTSKKHHHFTMGGTCSTFNFDSQNDVSRGHGLIPSTSPAAHPRPLRGILELMKTCLAKAFNLSKIQVLSSSEAEWIATLIEEVCWRFYSACTGISSQGAVSKNHDT